MNRKAVKHLMSLLGRESYSNNGWENANCPFGFLHGKGVDEHPSFGISVDDSRPSIYHCFGCMDKARPLDHLAFRLWRCKHEEWRRVAEFLASSENNKIDLPDIPEMKDPWITVEKKPEPVLPKRLLETFPLLCVDKSRTARLAKRYLEGRGISEKTWSAFGVRTWDYREVIVFPFTDNKDRIKVLRVRSVHEKSMFTISNTLLGYPDPFPTFKTSGALFSHGIDWSKPVLLVESELDAMRAFELGYRNVIAVGGSTVVPKQADRILSRTVLLGFDTDNGGAKATRCAYKRLHDKARLILIDWSKAKKNKKETCKDPGDLPDKQALQKALSGAVILR